MVRNDEPSFGKFLIQKRKERDITARQIAAELDCSPVYVCDIEKDRRPVTDVILKKLCGILRLTRMKRMKCMIWRLLQKKQSALICRNISWRTILYARRCVPLKNIR